MSKIAWKVIKGYGPYAYLQRSIKSGGKVTSKHLAYLGKAGVGGLVPGKYFLAPSVPGFPGGEVRVPMVGEETLESLKPKPKESVEWMAEQVEEGLPVSDITSTPPAVPKPSVAKAKPKAAKATGTTPTTPPAVEKASAPSPTPPAEPKQSGAATAAPHWVKVGEQIGSTPGALYQDAAGVKHYVKSPASDQHVKNELLAMDLYRLAGLAVPETFATTLDGKVSVASRYIEGLTGSGANPKDLAGTKEGFVADAWLANWDAVGVGSTKYDNILGLEGQAYRMDAGGALLYRGTGGPKGDKFGEEVTELAGLRDKQLNPVSETVFGGMTLQELAASATQVTTIPDAKIAAAVQEHFGDDPDLAQSLTAKLIARRNHINKQVNEQVMDQLAGQIAASGPATAMLQQKLVAQKAGAQVAAAPPEPQQLGATTATEPSYPLKLSDIPKDDQGKPLVTLEQVQKIEEALPKGLSEFIHVKWALVDATEDKAQKNAIMTTADLMSSNWQDSKKPKLTALEDSELPTISQGEFLLEHWHVNDLEEAASLGVHALNSAKWELIARVNSLSKVDAVLQVSDTLYQKVLAVHKPGVMLPGQGLTSTESATVKLDPDVIPKDQKGKKLLNKLEVTKLELAASAGLNTLHYMRNQLVEKDKAGGKTSAIYQAVKSLSDQLEEQKAQPDVVRQPVAEPPAEPVTSAFKLTDAEIPKDANGNPLVTKANIKKLEEVAAQGKYALADTYNEIAKNMDDGSPQFYALMDVQSALSKQLQESADQPQVDVPEPVTITAIPTLTPKAPPPKVTGVPKDNKGKPLVSAANVKKLESAAATNVAQLNTMATGLAEKMLSPAKKAAIQNVANDLKSQMTGVEVQEGDGGSGLSAAIGQVDDGQVKLPTQTVPTPAVVTQQVKLAKTGKKDYDKDLENVSGKKGSNEGGLFKDKKLQTLHYVKWPNSSLRAKNEVLAAHLYEYAQVPVPSVRLIKFNNQDAVMSDWIEDAAPMTVDVMKTAHDVQRNFAFDAWLANWDVVGTAADNIVQGPGNKAYRIDMGGSLLFRAQGKPRPFDWEVKELVTMRDQGINPKAAQVFGSLTNANLKEGAERLASVTDQQVDEAVDALDFPEHSDEYSQATYGKDASNLPKMLKDRLKARRDYIVDEIMFAEEKKAATLASLKDTVDLKPESLSEVLSVADTMTWSSPNTNKKWDIVTNILEKELGATKGKAAANALKNHYKSWKGTTNNSYGDMLRWAAGEMHSRGDVERSRLQKFNKFLIGKKLMSQGHAAKREETLTADIKKPTAKRLVEGLDIMQEKNEAVLRVQNPGKETMTVYRGWKPDQVEYLKLTKAKVGNVVKLNDPPLYSWSFTPGVAENFGHGSIVTKAEVPVDKVLLSDLANSVGSYAQENELVFKGVSDLNMEVIKKY